MSYIVAFVTYTDMRREFPVQCFRTDLKAGDSVIVRRTDGELRNAIVRHLEYLNWNCAGRIECKTSEATLESNGSILLPRGSPLIVGMLTADTFLHALRKRGWTQVKSTQRMYKVLAHLNGTHLAYIFVRRNGLDIQLMPLNGQRNIQPSVAVGFRPSEGRIVSHFLAHTTFNLYEGVLRFSDSFLSNEPDLDRYFRSQGEKDRRTDELKKQSEARIAQRSEREDIYYASSDGGGGPAYLSDGVWVTGGGRTHDWGR